MAKKATKKAAGKAVKKTAKKAAKKTATTAAKKTARKASKRELIDPGADKRFVRRSGGGQFKESDDVGRSLASDRRKKAKRKVKSGQGDKGDR